MTASVLSVVLSGAVLLVGAVASAQSCDEIATMVERAIPNDVIVQMISASGQSYADDEVQCLRARGVPEPVIDAAAAARPAAEAEAE